MSFLRSYQVYEQVLSVLILASARRSCLKWPILPQLNYVLQLPLEWLVRPQCLHFSSWIRCELELWPRLMFLELSEKLILEFLR